MKKKAKSKKAVAKKIVKSVAKKSDIQPTGDRVLLKPLSPEETGRKLASGIIIPETVNKEKPEQGTVVAVGPGKWDDGKFIPVTVKVGDRVMFSKYGFDEIKVNGVEYYIVSETSILAILNS